MHPVLRKTVRLSLWPLSRIWATIYYIRRFCYKYEIFRSYSFEVPIISIGNITFGGTGKTPFSLWLASFVSQYAKRTMILMRGYRGALEDGRGILRSEDRLLGNPLTFGDEALMLSRRMHNGSVVVGKRRVENLLHYFDQDHPDLVVLDDGHQHLRLKRDLNILLFDATMGLSSYAPPPLGYLREGLSAIIDADIIVIGRVDQVSLDKLAALKKLLLAHARPDVILSTIGYTPIAFLDQNFQRVMTLDLIRGKNVILAAGVASPNAFFKQMEMLGANVLERVIFPDHHEFLLEELKTLMAKVESQNAYLVVTEKDMVKIRRTISSDRIIYLEIDIAFLSAQDEVINKILSLLRE